MFSQKKLGWATFFKAIFLAGTVLISCFQAGCTLNTRIYELESPSSPSISPKQENDSIEFIQGTDISILSGDQISLSIRGAKGDVTYKDEGSGFVSPMIGKYASIFGTAVSSEIVEAIDSATSAVARIKIKIMKMANAINLMSLNAENSSGSRDGLRALAKSPNGTIWVAYRYSYDWIVAKSTDDGATYSVSDIFPSTDTGYQDSIPNAIVAKDDNSIFVVGHNSGYSNNQKFQVRRTLDGGNTWATVDTVGTFGSSFSLSLSDAKSAAVTPAGTILVAGDQCLSGCWPNFTWIIRRSIDNGNTWSTVSSVLGNSGPITVDPVTGYSYAIGRSGAGVVNVLKSTNDGATWTQVDSYTAVNGNFAMGGISARNGTIVFSGSDYFNWFTANSCNSSSWYVGFTVNRYWFSRISKDNGATWSNSEYLKISGYDSQSLGVTIAPSGTIYTSGVYNNYSTCQSIPVVRSSTDGITFTTVDAPSVPATYEYSLGSMYSDSSGAIFNYGAKVNSSGAGSYYLRTVYRKSSDAGATWTEGTTSLSVPEDTNSKLIFKDSAENMYASVDSTYFSFYKKSSDGGKSWTDLAKLPYPTGFYYTTSYGITKLANNILVAVAGASAVNKYHWYAFKSSDAGVTWTLTDDYYSAAGNYFTPSAIVSDKNNIIYASGSAQLTAFNSGAHAGYIRKSTDSGSTWTIADTYVYAAGKYTSHVDLFVDKNNTLYSLSNGYDASNLSHCILRKSTDGSLSWTQLKDVDSSNTVAGAYVTCGRILVDEQGSIYFSYHYYASGGPYYLSIVKSTDAGATWTNIFQKSGPSQFFGSLRISRVSDSLNFIFSYYPTGAEQSVFEIWRTRDEINWTMVDQATMRDSDMTECRSPDATDSKLCVVGSIPSILSFNTVWAFRTH